MYRENIYLCRTLFILFQYTMYAVQYVAGNMSGLLYDVQYLLGTLN